MKAIIERFDIDSVFDDANRKIGEIFPGSRAPVVTLKEGRKALDIIRWGVCPAYMKSDVINARRESLFTKNFFKRAVFDKRCLIPANYFYEWQKTDTGKIKRSLFSGDENLIAFAGIIMEYADKNKEIILPAYCIITREASDSVRGVHDRMPVILRRQDEDNWLIPDLTAENLDEIISRSVDEIKIA